MDPNPDPTSTATQGANDPRPPERLAEMASRLARLQERQERRLRPWRADRHTYPAGSAEARRQLALEEWAIAQAEKRKRQEQQ